MAPTFLKGLTPLPGTTRGLSVLRIMSWNGAWHGHWRMSNRCLDGKPMQTSCLLSGRHNQLFFLQLLKPFFTLAPSLPVKCHRQFQAKDNEALDIGFWFQTKSVFFYACLSCVSCVLFWRLVSDMISLHHLFLALRAQIACLCLACFGLGFEMRGLKWSELTRLQLLGSPFWTCLCSCHFMPASDGKETFLQIASAAHVI